MKKMLVVTLSALALFSAVPGRAVEVETSGAKLGSWTQDMDAAVKLAKEKQIKNVPLTIFDGEAGPPDYNISKDAGLNVMMWVKSNVKVNYAFAKPALDKATEKKVVGDTAKILE